MAVAEGAFDLRFPLLFFLGLDGWAGADCDAVDVDDVVDVVSDEAFFELDLDRDFLDSDAVDVSCDDAGAAVVVDADVSDADVLSAISERTLERSTL